MKLSKKKVMIIALIVAIIALLVICGRKPAAKAEDMKRIDVETLKLIKSKLEKLHRIETATVEVEMKGLKVTQDADGRVFVKDTVEIDVRLADLFYKVEAKTNAKVYVLPVVKKESIASRFGIMYAAMPKNNKYEKMDRGVIFATFKPIYYKKTSLELVANTKHYGLGLGYKFIHNTKLIGGAVWKFGDRPTRPDALGFVGVGVEF